jgi:hypothetical protein
MGEPVHPAALPHEQLLTMCKVRRGRTFGPGGQHRNKVETAIQITHLDSGVVGQAGERREQSQNLRVALFRLRVNLAVQVRVPVALAATPSDLWRSRVAGKDGRIVLNPAHEDFPAMLSEALDVIDACRGDVARAANLLACTPSQLVKLLKHDHRALAAVNALRAERGDHPLK